MGGRGGASGFPTNAPMIPATPKSAAETKDLAELQQYMSNIGVTVDTASLSGQDFENVRGAAAGISIIDQSLGINWKIPTDQALLSEKDTKHQMLVNFDSPFNINTNLYIESETR